MSVHIKKNKKTWGEWYLILAPSLQSLAPQVLQNVCAQHVVSPGDGGSVRGLPRQVQGVGAGRGQAAGLALTKEDVQSASVPVGNDRLALLQHMRQVQVEDLVGDVPAGRAELHPGDVLQVAAGANDRG